MKKTFNNTIRVTNCSCDSLLEEHWLRVLRLDLRTFRSLVQLYKIPTHANRGYKAYYRWADIKAALEVDKNLLRWLATIDKREQLRRRKIERAIRTIVEAQ